MSGSCNKYLNLVLVPYFSFLYPLLFYPANQIRNELPDTITFLLKDSFFYYYPFLMTLLNFIQTDAAYPILAFTNLEVSTLSFFNITILLVLWFYLRYRRLRVKKSKRDRFEDTNFKVEPPSNPVISAVTSTVENNMLFCLFCLLKNRYENMVIAESHIIGGNRWHKFHDTKKDSSLESDLNKSKFCDFLCMVNRKCYFPVDVLIPLTNHVDTSLNFDYSFEIVNFNHYEASSGRDNRIKTNNLNHHKLNYKILQPPVPSFSSYDQTFLRKAGEIIELNYTDNRFSVEQLAYKLNLTVSQVNRRLKALTDYPAGHLIRVFRLRHAAGLIISKTEPIAVICLKSGFNSQPYFSRAFKKQFGYSPSVYRKVVIEKSLYLRQ